MYFDLTDYGEEAKLDTQQLVNLIKLSNKQNNFRYTNSFKMQIWLFTAPVDIWKVNKWIYQRHQKTNKDEKNGAKLLVWGCLVKINLDSLKEVYDGPLIGPKKSWNFFCDYFFVPKRHDDVFANLLKNPSTFRVHKNSKWMQEQLYILQWPSCV